MRKEKEKQEFQKLEETYLEWEDFMSRSKIKMKKKIKKDKQQYYDFDYTRGQYYYNYPPEHISFAPPARQQLFFHDLLQKETQELSNAVVSQLQTQKGIDEDLSPLELHQYLKDFHAKVHERMAALRIRKTLYIRQNSKQKGFVNLLESEIRSYFYRYQKLQNCFFTFSQPLAERLQGVTSSLKIKSFDEMHFSQLEKGDFVVFLRMEAARQRVNFQLDCLLIELRIGLALKKGEIKGRCFTRRAKVTRELEKLHSDSYLSRREKIQAHFKETNIQFLQSDENLQLIEEYLTGLNFVHMYGQHRVQGGKPYLDGTKALSQLAYIPSGVSEAKNLLLSVTKNYFPSEMIQDLYLNKRENLCYRLNYFSSILLRTMSETNNFLVEIKEKDLHQIKSAMRRELETLFTSDVDRLFDLPQYEILMLVDEGKYGLEDFPLPQPKEQQIIFEQYFKQNRLVDPVSKALLALLDAFSQKAVIELAEQQSRKVIQDCKNKLRYLSLYYRNLHSDQKSHLINLMNAKMMLGLFNENLVAGKLDKILEEGEIDLHLIKTTYVLSVIRCIQIKKELDHVLTAQISLMYQLKYRVQLLKYKDAQPFEMTEEFMSRFMESNSAPQPFDFLKQTQRTNASSYPDPQLHDTIFRSKGRVEVRRMMPENPLFEGKRILYREALRESDVLMEKLHQICAYLIERRQNYLHEQAFTGVVDRFDLVHSLIKAELNFQTKKLSFLEELNQVLHCSIDPKGIASVARLMVETKSEQVYLSFREFNCLEEYQTRGDIFEAKGRVLGELKQRQIRCEEMEKKTFLEEMMRHNHQNNVPQISSIYYCDELPMEMDIDNIMEADEEEESCSDFSESQFMANSSKLKSDFSVISSDYHVKTTFKQILGRSAANSLAIDLNKREELMGRKKKHLLNDSALGGLIDYKFCKDYLYVHKSLQVMAELDRICREINSEEDWGIEREFYLQVESIMQSFSEKSIAGSQLVDQNLLHRILGDSSRAISKIIEKIKISPGAVDQYLFMASPILQKLVTSGSGSEVNDIRGLYTCLNVVQLSQLHYRYFLLGRTEQKLVQNTLTSVIREYSVQQIPKEGLYLSSNYVIEEAYFPSSFRMVKALTASKQSNLFFLGNYSRYLRHSLLVNQSFLSYYKACLLLFSDAIADYQLLRLQLSSMAAYNCYFASNPHILKIPSIENKVFVRKKLDHLTSHQNRVLGFNFVKEMLEAPKLKIAFFPKIVKADISSEQDILGNASAFQDFITASGVLAIEMQLAAQQVSCSFKQKAEIFKVMGLCQVLPFIQNHIQIRPIQSPIIKETFSEYFQHLSSLEQAKNQGQVKKVVLEYERISFASISRTPSQAQQEILKSVVTGFRSRKALEFGEKEEFNLDVYYHHLQIDRCSEPFRLHNCPQLKELFEFREALVDALKLRVWLEAKLTSFGASLNSKELLQLRVVLSDPENSFGVFWVDESSQLIRHTQLVRMRYESVEECSIRDHYTLRFITYQNLKVKYKQFLDSLGDLDIKNEGLQILGLLYMANKDIFHSLRQEVPEFLRDYCFLKKIKNQTSTFIQLAAATNPNRYLSKNPPFTLSLFKRFIWNTQALPSLKQSLVLLDERAGSIKQILNSNNTKMQDLTKQMGTMLYQGYRTKELMGFLGIREDQQNKVEYRLFLKQFQEDLLLGRDKLCPFEKYLSKFLQKVVKEKPELISVKDEMLEKIYQSRFNQKLILRQLYSMGRETLQKEVSLTGILLQNYGQKELMRENRIIRATLNKVLVPKIIINPYLESPLILDNYFFAASLKLSYVDSFLNRLKNRAIMVELAEGGFGFLLKINELDECIQGLCKGVITFTEKEFNDRLRTHFQAFDELQEKYRKAEVQNRYLKDMVAVSQEERGKELRSLLYGKLDSYLPTLHTREKTYHSLFNALKSLEVQITERVSQKFQNDISSLTSENESLKTKFAEFRLMMNQNARMSVQESKDTLCSTFKKDIEGVLNRQIFKNQKSTEDIPFEKQKESTVESLLRRLQTQKVFYEMKLSSQDGRLKARTQEINRLHHQLNSLQSTLSAQQERNGRVAEQIKGMHLKNIKMQELKREMAKREEEETVNRFKLIKINQNLQGKLAKIQPRNYTQLTSAQKDSRHERSWGVQTVEKDRPERRRLKMKTESSGTGIGWGSSVEEEGTIWREKWEKSERRYQALVGGLMQAVESYSMTKNVARLTDRLNRMLQEYSGNSRHRKI